MKKILGLAVAAVFVLTASAVLAAEQKAGTTTTPTAVEKKAETTTPVAKVAEPTKAAPVAKTEATNVEQDCLKKLNKTDAKDPAVVKCIADAKTNVAKAETPKAPAAVEKKTETTTAPAATEKKAEEKKN